MTIHLASSLHPAIELHALLFDEKVFNYMEPIGQSIEIPHRNSLKLYSSTPCLGSKTGHTKRLKSTFYLVHILYMETFELIVGYVIATVLQTEMWTHKSTNAIIFYSDCSKQSEH